LGTRGYQFLDSGNLLAIVMLHKLRPHVFNKPLTFGALQLTQEFLLWNVRLAIGPRSWTERLVYLSKMLTGT
jgi:hypothetical protein